MLRPLDLIMIGLLLGGVAFTYKVKQDSEQAIEQVSELEKAIDAERDAIDVLQADWSLLTDPKRVAELVEQYKNQLGIEPPRPEAIGSLGEIPIRPPEINSPPTRGIAELIDRQILDQTQTGAIQGAVANQ